MTSQWFTVVGAYADTKEGYLLHVQAEDSAAAKSKGYREADGVVIGLVVFPGRIDPVKADSNVTPLRRPGRTVRVSKISITAMEITVPSRCATCRMDLQEPGALLCGDLWLDFWKGHLTRDGEEIGSDRSQSKLPKTRTIADSVQVQCAKCGAWLHGEDIRA